MLYPCILVKLPLIDEKLKSENLFDVDKLIDACHQVADNCVDFPYTSIGLDLTERSNHLDWDTLYNGRLFFLPI